MNAVAEQTEPEGDPGNCRSCGVSVWWRLSDKNKKRTPFNRDGTSHFTTCPQAKDWSRR